MLQRSINIKLGAIGITSRTHLELPRLNIPARVFDIKQAQLEERCLVIQHWKKGGFDRKGLAPKHRHAVLRGSACAHHKAQCTRRQHETLVAVLPNLTSSLRLHNGPCHPCHANHSQTPAPEYLQNFQIMIRKYFLYE